MKQSEIWSFDPVNIIFVDMSLKYGLTKDFYINSITFRIINQIDLRKGKLHCVAKAERNTA